MAKSQHHPSYRPVPPLLRAIREDAGLTQRALGARLSRPIAGLIMGLGKVSDAVLKAQVFSQA